MTQSSAAEKSARATDSAMGRGISVVVPVYNSEGTLRDLAARLEPVLSSLSHTFELILVDDGSRDGSARVIRELAGQHPWVVGIGLMRNYGQHNAVLCGTRAARYDIIVTIDDDLQHPPEEVCKLLTKLNEGYDVVYGRPEREPHGFFRGLASRITKLVLKSAMGAETARGVSAFRAFRTSLRAAFAEYRAPYVSMDVLLTWATTRFSAVTVRHDPRTVGASNYTFWKLVGHALNMMTGFSSLPLQLASVLGFSFTCFGVGMLAYVVGRYFVHGGSVPGFPFLASALSIYSGVQLFVLGIIGEYLARMHFRMMERPTYMVRERADDDAG
jgi:undecaprenyl-phosphate 4-deoxy-4-formamido-L-arabinose transferase